MNITAIKAYDVIEVSSPNQEKKRRKKLQPFTKYFECLDEFSASHYLKSQFNSASSSFYRSNNQYQLELKFFVRTLGELILTCTSLP